VDIQPSDHEIKSPEKKPVEKLIYLPHRGKILASLTNDATVYFWRIVDSKVVYQYVPGACALFSRIFVLPKYSHM
jgi:hypothetical protein